jgi:hypothetical protein
MVYGRAAMQVERKRHIFQENELWLAANAFQKPEYFRDQSGPLAGMAVGFPRLAQILAGPTRCKNFALRERTHFPNIRFDGDLWKMLSEHRPRQRVGVAHQNSFDAGSPQPDLKSPYSAE